MLSKQQASAFMGNPPIPKSTNLLEKLSVEHITIELKTKFEFGQELVRIRST